MRLSNRHFGVHIGFRRAPRNNEKNYPKTAFLGELSLLRGCFSQHWMAVQNLHDTREDLYEFRTDWSSRVTKAIRTYSVSIWNARCKSVHNGSSDKIRVYCKEILSMIDEELKRTKHYSDTETRQLRKISKNL